MVLYIKTYEYLWLYVDEFFLKWEIFQAKFVEKIKTNFLSSVTLFLKSCRLWNNVEKYDRARVATDDNMTHAHCMLDKFIVIAIEIWLVNRYKNLKHKY